MIVPRLDEADGFLELTFKPGTWERRGIPETGCRMSSEEMERVIASGGSYQVEQLIHGLMDWLDVTDDPEPALATLGQMLDRHYPDDGRSHARCRFAPEDGGDIVFETSRNIACDGPVVAWHRRHWVIALAAAGDEAGRMVVGAPAPISLAVARSIHGHSMVNFMLEPVDSMEAARATSGRTGSYYSWEAGQATLLDWEYGLGLTMRDTELIEGQPRSEVLRARTGNYPPTIAAILGGSWRGKAREEVHSSGYVAHSLEAALWSIRRTADFRSAILTAANLGGDADTTAAITGQLAGALYGLSGIPPEWLAKLAWRERIENLARHLTDPI